MQLIRGSLNLRASERGCAVTIGTFDGLHLGHRALLERLRGHAARLARPTLMVTFEPMPREYLTPAAPPSRLTSFRERWRLLSATGLDYMWLLRFGESLRSQPAAEFAQLLARHLAPAVVVVGHDFRFGRDGAASVPTLQASGARLGFEVDVLPPVQVDGVRVSSSAIREALARGELAQAARWLGRPYSMRGRVEAGRRLGRKLGFPTANLRLGRRRAALQGIFAVRVHGAAPQPRAGVASLGTRPTVAGLEPLLEAHIFDFDADLYGREIEVEFVAKLREEARFASLDELVVQMRRDEADARRILQV
ncbi:MAG TPA: bifunctional riboflavin kinase/FAD synthetase [Steroidobacteraceae bacterium]|nr:bifunctional riboflavin kinase/FAD synthetase [Steroidobacteraceae bacterium]